MTGKMRKRKSRFTKNDQKTFGMAKSFHAPQKDNSKRAKRRFGSNQKEDRR